MGTLVTSWLPALRIPRWNVTWASDSVTLRASHGHPTWDQEAVGNQSLTRHFFFWTRHCSQGQGRVL